MEVKIQVKQEIFDGVVQPKRYQLNIDIPHGTDTIYWSKTCYLYDLDADTIKDLIPLLTKALENALKI